MDKSSRKGKKQSGRARAQQVSSEAATVRLGRSNIVLFGWALGVIVLGFVTLAMGSTTISAILLVGGYLVLVPWAILTRRGKSEKQSSSASDPTS